MDTKDDKKEEADGKELNGYTNNAFQMKVLDSESK